MFAESYSLLLPKDPYKFIFSYQLYFVLFKAL